MLGAKEENRKWGGEVSVGVRYPLLMPRAAPRALADIIRGKGRKCHVPAHILAARPTRTHSANAQTVTHLIVGYPSMLYSYSYITQESQRNSPNFSLAFRDVFIGSRRSLQWMGLLLFSPHVLLVDGSSHHMSLLLL